MTTLGVLAASSGSHSSSTVLMSSSSPTTNTSNANTSTSSNYASTSAVASSSLIDINDSNIEIKTEFYTREGLWRLVPNCEYIRQQQTQYQLQQQANNSQLNQTSSSNGQLSTNNQTYLNSNTTNPNDPVKIGIFNFSKRMFSPAYENDGRVCQSCATRLKLENIDHDDDDDVICTKFRLNSYEDDENDEDNVDDDEYDYEEENESEIDESYDDDVVINCSPIVDNSQSNKIICKYCNNSIILNDNNTKSPTSCSSVSTASSVSASPSLDMLIFNYAREIYFYEFNQIKTNKVFLLFIKITLDFVHRFYYLFFSLSKSRPQMILEI